MSQIDPSPLASYNSLQDKHLVGYFNNTRMKRHLRRSGLITKRGEIVSESTYRLNSARKDHKKHIKELMAQAIVHRALDMERHRQVDIKKKLEEIAKIELVRRVKTERQRKGDEDLLPLLSPRSHSSHMITSAAPSSSRDGRPKSAHPHRARTIVPPGRPRPLTAPGQSQSSLPVEFDEDGYPVRGTGQQTNENLFSKEDIDTQYLTGLDPVALQQFSVDMADFEPGIGGTGSPYHAIMVPQPPSPKSPKDGQKIKHAPMVTKDGKITRPYSNKGALTLHRKEPAYPHATQSQSMSDVSVRYRGKYINLPCDREDDRDEIVITQQHCGGENLTIFKGLVRAGDTMIFTSRRHRGFPFSLTFFINGIQEMRISTCCESKYKPGSKLKGQQASFTYLGVQGAEKCYRCVMEDEMKQKNKKKKKTNKRAKEEKEESSENINDTKDLDTIENEGTQVITYDDDFEEDDEGKKNNHEDIKSYDEDREKYAEDEFEEDDVSDAEAPREPNVVITHRNEKDSSGEEAYETSKTSEREQNGVSEASESETKSIADESEAYNSARSIVSERSNSENEVSEREEESKTIESEDNKLNDYGYSEDEFEKEEEKIEKTGENKENEEEKRITENYEANGSSNESDESEKEPEYNNNQAVVEITQDDTIEKEIEASKEQPKVVEDLSVEANQNMKDENEDNNNSPNQDEKNQITSDRDSVISENKRESDDDKDGSIIDSEKEAKDSESEEKAVSESSSAVLDTMAASMVSSALESACQKLEIEIDKRSESPDEQLTLTKSEYSESDSIKDHGKQSVSDDEQPQQQSNSSSKTATPRESEAEQQMGDEEEEDGSNLARQSETEPESESSPAGEESGYNHTTTSQSETETESPGSGSDKEQKSPIASGEGVTTSGSSSESSSSSSSESESEPESVSNVEDKEQQRKLSIQGKEEIYLDNMNITSEILIRNLNMDKVEDNIKILDLSNNKIDSSGASHIAELISSKLNTSIEKLSLAGNPIKSEGLAHIVAAIVESSPALIKLKILDLSNCVEDLAGAEAVSRLLLSHHTNIESLNLASNKNIPMEGWEMISRALQHNNKLKNLDLASNGLRSQGCAMLSRALMYNETLQVLNIEDNDIQDDLEGGQILIELVKENSMLTTIHASKGNHISMESLTQVKRILETGSFTEDDDDDKLSQEKEN